MNGSNLLIDTNIAIYLLDGDQGLAQSLNGKHIYVSFITEMELLSFKHSSLDELKKIKEMLGNCVIVDVNKYIKDIAIDLRKTYGIKLPDAIIAASSAYLNIPLVSADKKLKQIQEISLLFYQN